MADSGGVMGGAVGSAVAVAVGVVAVCVVVAESVLVWAYAVLPVVSRVTARTKTVSENLSSTAWSVLEDTSADNSQCISVVRGGWRQT